MSKSIKFILLLFSILITNCLSASQPKEEFERVFLARISTDYINKTYDLFIDLNGHKLISAIATRNNKKNKIKKYPVSVLGKPITLVKAIGITLVSLSCTHFSTSKGCDITIEYPYNITYGHFKKFKAKLKKVNSKWVLTDIHGKIFNHLSLKAKKALGLLIGIKKIIPKSDPNLSKV